MGYTHEQRRYEDRPAFDLAIHYGSIDYSHDFGGFKLGTTLDTTVANLSGASLLDSQRAGVYGSRLLGTRFWVRTALNYKSTDFTSVLARSSDAGEFTADAYYFVAGASEYIGLTYRFQVENARANHYDFSTNDLTLRYIKDVNFTKRYAVTFKADWRYQYQSYASAAPGNAEPRLEHRDRGRISLTAPITDYAQVELKYEYREHRANIESLSLTDNRAEARVILAF
jgi:hypothetical protein